MNKVDVGELKEKRKEFTQQEELVKEKALRLAAIKTDKLMPNECNKWRQVHQRI